MYVRGARNRDEVWLLDQIEAMGLDESAFRSRDYVIAVDETTNEKAGFGRIRVHKGDEDHCEITSVGVLDAWRGQGIGAHILERLVENASDQGFEEVYAFVDQQEYYEQFGFRTITEADLPDRLADRHTEKQSTTPGDAAPMRLAITDFRVPSDLREAFKSASDETDADGEPEERPEDFGIDPETATYKYDTGR